MKMYEVKQSDDVIVPKKAANKGAQAPAELTEGRMSIKGNPQDQSTGRTQGRGTVPQAVERIRQAVTRNSKERLTALLHHITPDTLRWAFYSLKSGKASGVDGVLWEEYEEGLEERLLDLNDRVHKGTYRAKPVRRVEIPKPDGGTRPLGIAALEDKIVQKAVASLILEPIYEAEFLGFSYGFRPGRGAHDALDALAYCIEKRKVNWIVDADIQKFFDRIDRDWMIRFLEHRIGDRRVIRLITKWLNAGVMEDGEWKDDMRGTPQGAVVTPRTLLATLSLTVKSNTGDLLSMLTSIISRSIYMLHGEIIKYGICSASQRGIRSSCSGAKPRRCCKRNDAVPGALKTTVLSLSGRGAEALRAGCGSGQQGNADSQDFQTTSSGSASMGSRRWMYAKRLCRACAGRGDLKTWRRKRLRRFPRVARWYLSPYLTVLRTGSWFGHSGLWFRRICC